MTHLPDRRKTRTVLLVKPYHDWMPAILTPDAHAPWFVHDADLAGVQALLKPGPQFRSTGDERSLLLKSVGHESGSAVNRSLVRS
jgi:putative SOS response-associated peptidase YedK